jgi:asparagine synthase (glutamine-hydrolysing)
MCGICGKLNFDRNEPVDPGLLGRMMDLLQHRGPDGEGEYRSGPVALGHRRLSIIDLAGGGQPMCNEDGTVWLVYNGEVYNFQELRAELEGRGHQFKSATDTEVILHLYEDLGLEAVARLRGMFAFALWDERKQLLLLARDRVGVKPLYYANTSRALLFASEMKSLLADPSVPRRLNPQALDRFLTYYYLPGTETLLQDVHKLSPGFLMTVQDGRVSTHQFWDLSFPHSPRKIEFEAAVSELREVLRRSVKDHMISDVPVGVLLSGGVDSTGVLRYAAEDRAQPIRTFTIGFEGAEFADERPYARLAAERYGSIHQDMTLTAEDFRAFMPEYIWHMEEPVCEPPAVALYYVARLARQSSVKVLLSGEGGDEAFGGYHTYRNLLWLEGLKSAFGPAKGLLRYGLQALGNAGWEPGRRYSKLIQPSLSQYYFSRTANPATLFNRSKPDLYRREFARAVGTGCSEAPTRRLFEQLNGESLLERMLYVDTKTWLPDDLLVKADKMTMATSVELRVPLLDHQVLEFAASLPGDFKVRGRSLKRVLKAALADSVPAAILQRKKTGFPVPYDRWLRTELREFVMDTVGGAQAALSSYFDRNALHGILEHQQQGGGGAKEVFSLLVLELWHQRFLSGPKVSAPSRTGNGSGLSLHPEPMRVSP